jgi:hypothetical protein
MSLNRRLATEIDSLAYSDITLDQFIILTLACHELLSYQGGENGGFESFDTTQSDYTLKMTPVYSSEI